MTISNQSAGLRSGVCTSSTRPVTPFNGQVIYETDTKQTLVWQGSSWVMLTDADSPPALQLITTQAIGSAVSSQQTLNAFNADFDHYKITISGMSCSITAQLRMIFGSTNSGYYYGNPLTNISTGAYDHNRGSNVAYIDLGAIRSDIKNDFVFDVLSPYNTTRTKVVGFGYMNSADFGGLGSGLVWNDISYTNFTINPSAGTITGGTIRVYGYRN